MGNVSVSNELRRGLVTRVPTSCFSLYSLASPFCKSNKNKALQSTQDDKMEIYTQVYIKWRCEERKPLGRSYSLSPIGPANPHRPFRSSMNSSELGKKASSRICNNIVRIVKSGVNSRCVVKINK